MNVPCFNHGVCSYVKNGFLFQLSVQHFVDQEIWKPRHQNLERHPKIFCLGLANLFRLRDPLPKKCFSRPFPEQNFEKSCHVWALLSSDLFLQKSSVIENSFWWGGGIIISWRMPLEMLHHQSDPANVALWRLPLFFCTSCDVLPNGKTYIVHSKHAILRSHRHNQNACPTPQQMKLKTGTGTDRQFWCPLPYPTWFISSLLYSGPWLFSFSQ